MYYCINKVQGKEVFLKLSYRGGNYFNEFAVTATNALNLSKSITQEKKYYLFFRRIVDIFVSIIGLIVSSPIILFFMLLIIIESPGSPIYQQVRVGQNGKYFKIYKLRSMRIDAEVNGAKWAEKNDPRVTRVGKFIRKTRIDELPQFYNILKGDMSLIGPRPERPEFTAQFNEEIPGFIFRLSVKPGLTGWAQINGGYDISPKEKFELDKFYIENFNLKMDIKILFKTIIVCLTGYGAR